ncbi:MAG: ABC transporter permease DevC [Halioglobus sp.]
MSDIFLGWALLKHEKIRFTVAVLGVSFAVSLILMQIGFREAMFDSGVRMHRHWVYDLALISPETVSVIGSKSFTSRRLYQALSLEQVESVQPVYLQHGLWKDVDSGDTRDLFVIGFDPAVSIFKLPAIQDQLDTLKMENYVLFDARARPEFGPVADILADKGVHTIEINGHKAEVRGLFPMGPSFGINGTVIAGTDNFLRIFPGRSMGVIDVGLIRLHKNADIAEAKRMLKSYLPRDVQVYDKAEFIQKEVDYWATNTPIGYVFGFGILIGLVVGSIIVYQILFADVSDHIAEYATLKAMGYSNFFLSTVVIQQAVILAIVGFIPGLMLSMYLYTLASDALMIELVMNSSRALFVLGITVAMCVFSALLALRKVRAADPASIF